jgi:membrane protease subunit HflK
MQFIQKIKEQIQSAVRFIKSLWPVVIVGLIAGGVFLYWDSFYIQLESHQRAVVLRFGNLSDRVLQPGANWRLPEPIETIIPVDVASDRKTQVGFHLKPQAKMGNGTADSLGVSPVPEEESLTITKGRNLVELDMEVNYSVTDPAKWVLIMDKPEQTVQETAESVMRQVVGKYQDEEVLTYSKREVSLAIRDKLQEVLDGYDIGVHIRSVLFVKAVIPDPVLQSFEDVENAKQESEKVRYQALQRSNLLLREAQGDSSAQLEEARGYAESVLLRAQGDSARFVALLKKYKQYPQVTQTRLYQETMQAVLPKVKKVIVDSEKGSSPITLLPVGKL